MEKRKKEKKIHLIITKDLKEKEKKEKNSEQINKSKK